MRRVFFIAAALAATLSASGSAVADSWTATPPGRGFIIGGFTSLPELDPGSVSRVHPVPPGPGAGSNGCANGAWRNPHGVCDGSQPISGSGTDAATGGGVAAGSGQYRPQTPTGSAADARSQTPEYLVGDAKLANYGKDSATPYKGVSPPPYTDASGSGGSTGTGGSSSGGVGGASGSGGLGSGWGGTGDSSGGIGSSAGSTPNNGSGVSYGGDVLPPVGVQPDGSIGTPIGAPITIPPDGRIAR